MERERISKTQEKVDGVLAILSGGVIGILAALAESNILSQSAIDTKAAILAGGSTIVGGSLFLNGVVRLTTLRRRSKE